MWFLFKKIWWLQKLPVGFATTDQPNVAAAFKTNNTGESEKCSVDTNVLYSDSNEHIVCDSQDRAGTITKDEIPGGTTCFRCILAIPHLIV